LRVERAHPRDRREAGTRGGASRVVRAAEHQAMREGRECIGGIDATVEAGAELVVVAAVVVGAVEAVPTDRQLLAIELPPATLRVR
jgi:hypothetical protein